MTDAATYQAAWNQLRKYLGDTDYGVCADAIAKRASLEVITGADICLPPITARARFNAALERGTEL